MKHVILVSLLVAVLGVSSLPTQACFCILPELSDSFAEARAVFLGETIHITEPKRLDPEAPIAERAFTIKFKIVQSWKGVPPGASEFSILWLTNCYECLALPRMNGRYLVFADPIRDNEIWSVVTMCNRTKLVEEDPRYRLMNHDAIDRDRDVKRLDIITKRALTRPRV